MDSEVKHSFIVYRKEMALKLVLFSILSLLLLYLSNHFLENKFLSLLFLIIIVTPFFFLNAVIKFFTRKVDIVFKEDIVSISIYKKGGENTPTVEYHLNNIKSYSIQFPTYRFSSIKLNFLNGKFVEYSFLTKKQEDEQVATDELLDNFHSLIQNYNRGISDKEKIFFQPSFFASRIGLLCIFGLTGLFCITCWLHFLYQPQSSLFILFFVFAIIIQLILKRKTDIAYYKKMS